MAISDAAWDGSASQWKDASSYCASCLINENEGDRKNWTKGACKLPYKFPNGDVSRNAVHAAAAALAGSRGGIQASPSSKKKAARKLKALYAQLKEDLPPSIKTML